MLLNLIGFLWNAFLLFLVVMIPTCLYIGYTGKMKELEREEQIKVSLKKEKEQVIEEKVKDDKNYRTVKKEAGSYSVFSPDGTEAIVIRVNTQAEGNLWVAALAVKDGKSSERVKTKKEAVALAIELLKEHKGN